jgi:DNA polymerase-1
MDKLFLIDANGLLYRAFFALPPMFSDKGFPTNALYGFTTVLFKILKEYEPNYIAVAYDVKGPTFRHEIFKDYKFERPPMPDQLVPQIDVSKKICQALGISTIELEKFEADDIISYLAKKAANQNFEVIIVTSDKDLFQLVDDKIKILHPKNYEFYDSKKILEKIGVLPHQIPDFLALVGDKSDGIPGVAGIGEKTAANLLSKFKTIDDIYANLNDITPLKIKTSLENSKDTAFVGKKLATLQDVLPIDIDLSQLKLKDININKLNALFKELQFTSLIGKISNDASKKEIKYEIILQPDQLINAVKQLINQDKIALHLLTQENNFCINIIGLSLSSENNKSYYLPLTHNYIGVPNQLDIESSLRILKPLFSNKSIKIVHDIKSISKIFSIYNIKLDGEIKDLMLLSYLINPTKYNHSIEELAKEYLSYSIKGIKDIVKKEAKKIDLATMEIEKAASHLCEQTQILLRLYLPIQEKVRQYNLEPVYNDIELPLSFVLKDMESKGVKIDTKILNALSIELEKKLEKLANEIYDFAGEIFNINSPQQVSYILFKKLKLPATRKTKITKMLSTGTEVLEELAEQYEFAKLLLEYRQLFKLKSTYLDTLTHMINPATKRVHTIFNQTATATGRLSSSNPNLQNIPIRSPIGKQIREAFVAEENNFLISADYSQIELRILAHFSNDENLISAFNNNVDIHSLTASKIFGVSENEVSPELRSKAKAINFGIIYGLSAFGLSKQIGCTPDEAQIIIDSYFHKHPKVEEYIKKTLQLAASEGYVETLFGRKRFISGITKENKAKTPTERAAINMPIQGTAADIIKLAMIKLHKYLKENNLKSDIILQIHDELVLETPFEEVDHIKEVTKNIMEKVVALKVPLKVEIGIGRNWAEAH